MNPAQKSEENLIQNLYMSQQVKTMGFPVMTTPVIVTKNWNEDVENFFKKEEATSKKLETIVAWRYTARKFIEFETGVLMAPKLVDDLVTRNSTISQGN